MYKLYIFYINQLIRLIMEPSNSGLSSSLKFFAIDSKPYGSTYSEWIAKYYEWIASIPENQNHPVFDKTGAKCANYQTNSQVLFLPSGPTGHSITRKCTIATHKAILLCLLFSLCDEKVDKKDISTDPIECIEDGLRDTKITLTVDGITFDGKLQPDINKFKVEPIFFNVSYAKGNYLSASAPGGEYTPGKNYKSIIGGYMIILEPLPIGEHKIYYDVTSRGCTMTDHHVNMKYFLEAI
jgi:hypothetical protein